MFILRSLANARKCQLKDFCEKERYESCSVQRMFTADAFRKVRKGEKLACSDATTRFPQASCFEKLTRSVPETWGRMYDVLQLGLHKRRLAYNFSSYVGRTQLRI